MGYRYTLHRAMHDLWADGRKRTALVRNVEPVHRYPRWRENDPTVRRVIGFTRRMECTDLIVCNVYALRSTDPQGLLDVNDPVGESNDASIAACAQAADVIVAAWGNPPARLPKGRTDAVLSILRRYGNVYRLGRTTKAGQPRHPLYLRADEPLEIHGLNPGTP